VKCGEISDENFTANLSLSVPVKTFRTRSTAIAEIADRTAYDALINDHFDKNTLPCS